MQENREFSSRPQTKIPEISLKKSANLFCLGSRGDRGGDGREEGELHRQQELPAQGRHRHPAL